jgi:hypothetical protein
MIFEEILVGESILTALVVLGLIFLSVWKRKIVTSEAAWEKLMVRSSHLKNVFRLASLSLIIYLVAESAELMSETSPYVELESVHEIGEALHMFIGMVALFAVIPLYRAMLGGEDDS